MNTPSISTEMIRNDEEPKDLRVEPTIKDDKMFDVKQKIPRHDERHMTQYVASPKKELKNGVLRKYEKHMTQYIPSLEQVYLRDSSRRRLLEQEEKETDEEKRVTLIQHDGVRGELIIPTDLVTSAHELMEFENYDEDGGVNLIQSDGIRGEKIVPKDLCDSFSSL